MEDSTLEESEQNREVETEVAPALIAVHPTQQSVAVAVGSDLRVFNLQEGCPVSLVDASSEAFHKDSIRAIRYGANGKLFVSAGDDKLVKIWNTDSWNCLYSVSSEKRVSAVAITDDGQFVCFADKFGVVWVVGLDGFHENQPPINKKASPLLSHYCSIITSLEFSPGGQFIITSDRDFKIRVTMFPKKPLDGAHEIQSFCLGHTEFVSCLAFVYSQEYPQGFLVSGSGDSTVRMWDFTSGSLLDTCEVGAEDFLSNSKTRSRALWATEEVYSSRISQLELNPESLVTVQSFLLGLAGLLQSNGREEDSNPAVTDLSVTPGGSLIAVAIQNLAGILLLGCNLSARTLSAVKVVSISEETFIPTSLGATFSTDFLWMVMGVSSLHGPDCSSLSRVRVISGFSKSNPDSSECKPLVLADKEIPGGEALLQKLQGNLVIEKEVFSAAAEAVKTAMQNLLIKKHYSADRREFRKRGRNDKKKVK